jgi:hypothetical protein
MPLWGKYDNAANSDIAALIQYNQSTGNSAARTLLFENTTANTVVKSEKGAGNVVVGQFGVDTKEIQAANKLGASHPQHSGWVIRHEGRGLKAGRVWYETLVATGSIISDGNDDTYFPDYALYVTSNPASTNGAANVTLTVAASSTPSGAPITYKWQRNPGTGWVDVANVAGLYYNNTSPTLTVNAAIATSNVFRADIIATGANTVYSANATVTTP